MTATATAKTAPATDRAPFGRVLTAMVTPFTDDGSLDLDAAQKLATALVDLGNDGLVVSGTTGESPTTSDSEKVDLLRAVLDAVGDRATIIAGVGTFDTAHTVETARSAAAAGAHALLVVTPYYSKPPQAGLVLHFRTVADATELPVMIYDIPGRTGVPVHTETLIELAQHERIVAVKDAKGDLAASTQVLAATDLAYYCGADELNLAMLAIGAVGVVSVVGHVAAERYAALVRAVDAGDLATARQIDRALLPAVRGIMTYTQGAIMAKAAMQLRGVLSNRVMRSPLVAATDDEVGRLRADLSSCGLLE